MRAKEFFDDLAESDPEFAAWRHVMDRMDNLTDDFHAMHRMETIEARLTALENLNQEPAIVQDTTIAVPKPDSAQDSGTLHTEAADSQGCETSNLLDANPDTVQSIRPWMVEYLRTGSGTVVPGGFSCTGLTTHGEVRAAIATAIECTLYQPLNPITDDKHQHTVQLARTGEREHDTGGVSPEATNSETAPNKAQEPVPSQVNSAGPPQVDPVATDKGQATPLRSSTTVLVEAHDEEPPVLLDEYIERDPIDHEGYIMAAVREREEKDAFIAGYLEAVNDRTEFNHPSRQSAEISWDAWRRARLDEAEQPHEEASPTVKDIHPDDILHRENSPGRETTGTKEVASQGNRHESGGLVERVGNAFLREHRTVVNEDTFDSAITAAIAACAGWIEEQRLDVHPEDHDGTLEAAKRLRSQIGND